MANTSCVLFVAFSMLIFARFTNFLLSKNPQCKTQSPCWSEKDYIATHVNFVLKNHGIFHIMKQSFIIPKQHQVRIMEILPITSELATSASRIYALSRKSGISQYRAAGVFGQSSA
jgi:hypothetical protein